MILNAQILKNETFTQAIKYFFVGGFCTVIDLTLLYVLTKYCDLNYLISSIISFMSGTVLNYYLCTLWIFKVRVVENKYHEFTYYLIITGVALGINTLLIWGFTAILGIYFMFSKILATIATYIWNFWARKYFLHTVK